MCLKLVKWAAIGVIVVGGVGYFIFGEHLGSYARTMTNSVRESVRGTIPIEFELKRAARLIQAIEPELNECKRDVARAEVELEHLLEQVTRLEKRVEKQENKLKSGCNLLSDATPASYELGGRNYSRRRVELDLERTFEAYKNNKALLKGKRMLIERQSRAVDAARAKLDAVRAEKSRLDHTIVTLKAQKRQVDALAASSRRFDLDDTALSKAKEVLAKVKTRLDVAQKMIEDDIFFSDGIQAGPTPNRDIVKEITEHLSGPVAAEKQLTERGRVTHAETR